MYNYAGQTHLLVTIAVLYHSAVTLLQEKVINPESWRHYMRHTDVAGLFLTGDGDLAGSRNVM